MTYRPRGILYKNMENTIKPKTNPSKTPPEHHELETQFITLEILNPKRLKPCTTLSPNHPKTLKP